MIYQDSRRGVTSSRPVSGVAKHRVLTRCISRSTDAYDVGVVGVAGVAQQVTWCGNIALSRAWLALTHQEGVSQVNLAALLKSGVNGWCSAAMQSCMRNHQ
jgi:hypothetical protein